MGHIDKGDVCLLLDALELNLHGLAQLEVKGAQGLVEQQHVGLVGQGPGNGNALLLSAGQGRDAALFKADQIDKLEHLEHLGSYFGLWQLLDAKPKGHVFIDVEKGEQRIFLKDGVEMPLVGRNVCDIFAVKKDAARVGIQEPSDDAERCRFSTARRAKQRNKFTVFDFQVDVIKDNITVKAFRHIDKLNDIVVCHFLILPPLVAPGVRVLDKSARRKI